MGETEQLITNVLWDLLLISGKICVDPQENPGMVETVETVWVLRRDPGVAGTGGPARGTAAVSVAVLTIYSNTFHRNLS